MGEIIKNANEGNRIVVSSVFVKKGILGLWVLLGLELGIGVVNILSLCT